MVAHVLINLPPGDVHSLIVFDFEEDFGEALESLRELVDAVVHLAKVESTTGEVLVFLQGSLEHLNG